MPHRLNPEEKALWARVVESVRPIRPIAEAADIPLPGEGGNPEKAIAPLDPGPRRGTATPAPKPRPEPGTTLDASWDRRLARGLVQPDLTVDLHGHHLDGAYRFLDLKLEQAIVQEARLLLLITGKPPGGEPPHARGRIRAAVHDWLAASRHAGSIAAVRGAHPRHGGAGALYVVLRRRRPRG